MFSRLGRIHGTVAQWQFYRRALREMVSRIPSFADLRNLDVEFQPFLQHLNQIRVHELIIVVDV